MMLQSSEAPYPNRRYRPTKPSRPAETTQEFSPKNRGRASQSPEKTGLVLSTVCKQLECKSRMLGNVQQQDVEEQQIQDKHCYSNSVNERVGLCYTSDLINQACPGVYSRACQKHQKYLRKLSVRKRPEQGNTHKNY